MKHTPSITLSEPFPLLDAGQYVARCTEATYAWSRQWKKWIARLVLEPLNYEGRPYSGRLCKFFGLGKDPEKPYAGPQSHFRRLFVEVNGDQPTSTSGEMAIFADVLYDIEVETVTTDREGKCRSPEHWYSIVRGIHPHRCQASMCCCKSGLSSTRTPQPLNTAPSNPSTLRTRTTFTTDQHSHTANTPLARERVLAGRANFESLGNRSSDQKHDYPEGGAGYDKLASPGKEKRESEGRLREPQFTRK